MLFSKKGKADRQPEIRVGKGAFANILVKRAFTIVGIALLSVFIIYLCFASTLMRIVPTISGSGMVAVKENTYQGGNIPTHVQILVDRESPQPNNHLDRLKQAFIPSKHAAVINVEAGPFGKLKWVEPGFMMVNDKMTESVFAENPKKEFLKNEYMGVCVSGACEIGEGVIVNKDNIYGIVITEKEIEKVS